MKSKRTSQVKKKVKKVAKTIEDLTILDLARGEKDAGVEVYSKPDGSGRQYTREVFKMWCVLPDTFKGAPERITSLLGITDAITLELLGIATMQQFADTFGVIPQTLSRWRKDIEVKSDYLDEVKRAFKPLTKNLLAALYRTALEQGDAARALAYMKIIEGWHEQLGIEHTGSIGEGLTDEERSKLDQLLEKNTRP